MADFFGNTLGASKQKHTQSAVVGFSRAQCVENIRSRHSFPDWDPQQAGNPYQWHAIHRAKIAHQQRFTKLLVGPTHHQEIDVRRRQQKLPAKGRLDLPDSTKARLMKGQRYEYSTFGAPREMRAALADFRHEIPKVRLLEDYITKKDGIQF